MKYYVATSIFTPERHREVVAAMEELGHELTYDWTVSGQVYEEGEPRMQEVAKKEIDAVAESDFLVVFLPGGRGTHAELGAGLVRGIPIFVYATKEDKDEFLQNSGRPCLFYWHEQVERVCGPIQDLVDAVGRRWPLE